jgi:hypothetical protein
MRQMLWHCAVAFAFTPVPQRASCRMRKQFACTVALIRLHAASTCEHGRGWWPGLSIWELLPTSSQTATRETSTHITAGQSVIWEGRNREFVQVKPCKRRKALRRNTSRHRERTPNCPDVRRCGTSRKSLQRNATAPECPVMPARCPAERR